MPASSIDALQIFTIFMCVSFYDFGIKKLEKYYGCPHYFCKEHANRYTVSHRAGASAILLFVTRRGGLGQGLADNK